MWASTNDELLDGRSYSAQVIGPKHGPLRTAVPRRLYRMAGSRPVKVAMIFCPAVSNATRRVAGSTIPIKQVERGKS